MKIVFDILGSTEKSGGMRLHATEVIQAWLELYPNDEVTLVGGSWAAQAFSARGADVVRWPNESIAGRATGQLVVSAIVALTRRADVLVSLSPIVSPLPLRAVTACFQHDWRHKKNPHEFPLHQRVYRWLWEASARRATINVCISRKAETETRRFAKGAVTRIIENGRDHARDWLPVAPSDRERRVTTFGHHNNKRPELAIRALALVNSTLSEHVRMTVLGARGAYQQELRDLAEGLDIANDVDFPGFVSDDEYQRLISTSSAIVLPSSDEGFGLPVAEAEYLNIPAVVTSDSGMADIFGTFPIVAAPTDSALASAILEALEKPEPSPVAGEAFSWNDTAKQLRECLVGLAAGNGRSPSAETESGA